MAASVRKPVLAVIKVLISGLLLYFVFTKIPFKDVWATVRDTRFGYLLLAVILFAVSKIVSAYRLNHYFRHLGIAFTQIQNLKLYLLGMFYNLFLPGGIGGDAYKGWYIRKNFPTPTPRVVASLVLDRLSGLVLLWIYACLLAIISPRPEFDGFRLLAAIMAILAVFSFLGIHLRFFRYLQPIFWKSLAFSALVQAAQLASALAILYALEIDEFTVTYLFVFLLSSIVAVLPLTIGGVGSRELVFYYGAVWFGLEEGTSVSISMLFFLITALISLLGVYYHFRKPDLDIPPA